MLDGKELDDCLSTTDTYWPSINIETLYLLKETIDPLLLSVVRVLPSFLMAHVVGMFLLGVVHVWSFLGGLSILSFCVTWT